MTITKQKISLDGFIHAQKDIWDDDIRYLFFNADMSQHGYVVVQPFTIEVEINNYDFNKLSIKALKAKKEKIQANSFVEIKKIDEEIQNLLSIENKS